MEQQSNKEANQGWRFAAGAARITVLNTGSEDRRHTSGVMFVAVVRNLGAVGRHNQFQATRGRVAPAVLNVRGGMWVLLRVLLAF